MPHPIRGAAGSTPVLCSQHLPVPTQPDHEAQSSAFFLGTCRSTQRSSTSSRTSANWRSLRRASPKPSVSSRFRQCIQYSRIRLCCASILTSCAAPRRAHHRATSCRKSLRTHQTRRLVPCNSAAWPRRFYTAPKACPNVGLDRPTSTRLWPSRENLDLPA